MLTYTYRYNRIIKWFQDHPITKESNPESEYHHIIPRACGGSNIKTNIVLLPTRWHYIVHCWLPAVYLEQGKQKEYEKMLFAWNRFQNYRKTFRDGLQTVKEDSLLYQKLKQEYFDLIKQTQPFKVKGNKNGRFGTHWWKDPNDKTKTMCIKEGDPVPEGWIKGYWTPFSKNGLEKLINQKKHFGYIIITNGIENRRIHKDEPIPDGFWKGYRPKKSEFNKNQQLSKEDLFKLRSNISKRGHQTRYLKLKTKKYLLLKEQFEYYQTHTWNNFKENFNYKYSQSNFIKQCKRYLKDEWYSKYEV